MPSLQEMASLQALPV